MRVFFLTHYYAPEVGAPQTRISLVAEALAQRGHEVTVHTGFPHYPDGVIRSPYRNRPWQVEHAAAVTVVRSAVYPAANRGFTRRLANHASLAASALATASLSGPADVVVGETPPLFTASAGVAYARVKHAAYVVNVADRWPASAVELGVLHDSRAIAAAAALERWTYAHADLITAPTAGIVGALSGMAQVGDRARRVWPVVDLDRFAPTPTPTPNERAASVPLRLLYAGTVGLAQGLDVLAQATQLAGPEVVQTTIAGGGAEAAWMETLIRDRAIPNLRMLGVVSAEEIPALYAGTDAAAVLLRDLPIFEGALPTKLLEAMAAGRPVLVAARGEAAELVTTAGAGLVVTPNNPAALAHAIKHLRSDPGLRAQLGQAGRRYAERHLGVGPAGDAWGRVLSDAVAARRLRRPGSGPAAADRYRAGRA